MKTPQYQLDAVKKYQQKLDRIEIKVPKGTKEKWTQEAQKNNQSLTKYIIEKVNKKGE